TSAVIPLNTWTHITATYDGTTESVYINGQPGTSSTLFSGPVGTNPSADVFIGADREVAGPTYFWNGYLDEVRIWSVSRSTPQDRETMFTGTGTTSDNFPHYAGLEAVWNMQNAAGSGVFDFGPTLSHFATFVNGAAIDVQAPPLSYNVGLEL